MENYIDKLYNLLHSAIVTPYNLLENAKLDNYNYVKYYKGKSGLIAEMQCINEDTEEVIFFYEFNKKDELEKIVMKNDTGSETVFSRNEDIENVKERIKQFSEIEDIVI